MDLQSSYLFKSSVSKFIHVFEAVKEIIYFSGAGINHKKFGVTSIGLIVYLEVALRNVGIDPLDTFTVKLVGGPRGDIAGNTIKMLCNDYGRLVKFVGIADGSGVAEDPLGLDHAELLRLVREELPISCFSKSRLSPRGQILSVEETAGAKARNEMWYRVESDVFIPAGGRLLSINDSNWRLFIKENGLSSKIIVEGASLYVFYCLLTYSFHPMLDNVYQSLV